VFVSWASNLTPNDTNAHEDAFARDLQAGTTTCVSVDAAGIPRGAVADGQIGEAQPPSISADGRFVAFVSFGAIVPQFSGFWDVYVRDMVLGQTTLVSRSMSGTAANGDSRGPAITPDGRFVAFVSQATNLTPVQGVSADVFVRDLTTGSTQLVNVAPGGGSVTGASFAPAITPDGAFIAFASVSPDLVPGDTNGELDVFLRDVVNGTTTRVNVDSAGLPQATGTAFDSLPPALSDDARQIAFTTSAAELAPFDGNGVFDVYVHDRSMTLVAFCGTDGIASHVCPCSNGAPGRGCANSVFAAGAELVGSGDTSVSNDTLRLDATGLTGNGCVFYAGDASSAPSPLDDGLGCVTGTIVRIATKPVGGNASTYPEPGDPSISLRLGVPAAGGRRFAQGFYRNAAPFCGAATSNRTNAIAITFVP